MVDKTTTDEDLLFEAVRLLAGQAEYVKGAAVFTQDEFEILDASDPDVDLEHGRRAREFCEAVVQRHPTRWAQLLKDWRHR